MTPDSLPSYTFLDTTILTQSPPPPPLQTDPQTHTEPTTPASPTPINSPQLNIPQSKPSHPPLPIQQPSPQLLDIPNQPSTEPLRTYRMVTRSQSGIVKPIDRLSPHTTCISPLPKSSFLALQNSHWKITMHDEYNALVKNGTWILVPRPVGINLVRSMWLFKHKFHFDGTLSCYKARLVANGSSQQLGINCDETFSPLVKLATIRTVLSLTVSRKWPIHQLDVKNSFRNGDLSETLYMHKPPGFVDHRDLHVMPLMLDFTTAVVTLPYSFFVRDLSAEVEYQGVANVVAETAWLRNLLRELHSPLSAATLVYCDNSPDGKLFGIAYLKSLVQIYSYHGGDDIRNHLEIEAHAGSVNDLAFSYPNKILSIVTCGDDKLIKGRIVRIKRLLSAVEVTVAGYAYYCW
nr:ribonuclease H-like domain-containing protein [Tanacetum cinerariifolium]